MKLTTAAGTIVAGLALSIGGTAVAAPALATQASPHSTQVPARAAGPQHAVQSNGDTLGVKLRVINNTDHGVTPFTVKANGSEHEVAPGNHYDVSGKSNWWGQDDVNATVRSGPAVFGLWGYNPDIGYPSVGVGNSWERYSVGESHTRIVFDYSVKVTRLADEDFKVFTVEVSKR